MTEQELIDTLLLVLVAGHETTVNLIGNAVHALLTHPEQLELVRAGELSWNDVIEETLRWAPGVANLPLRFAVEDIEIPGGPTIRKGEAILPSFAATGRDPQQHGDTAEQYEARRPSAEHLSFGHGVHRCLGAPWPVWKPRSPSRRSSTASPTWNSPCSQRRWHRQAASSSEA
ncbi:cytochrome P450 [Streptomyces aureus]